MLSSLRIRAGLRLAIALLVATAALAPLRAAADADALLGNNTALGLQPIAGPIPVATPAPGESPVFRRPDGSYQAIPQKRGRVRIFHLVERKAPWTLKPGMTVMANTYNGVVPGPVIQVRQGDEVVIDYRNDDTTPDTIHLHGIHDIPPTMDGVGGISQPMVPPGGTFQYRFRASAPGTFMYHTHDNEAMLDSGLYGAIIVLPTHPLPYERNLAHDFLEVISSWQVRSGSENQFTLNGKEYPLTQQLNVREGQRFRIRWINISGEEFHTMHTHGHYQTIVARDAVPLTVPVKEDTVLVGPGQRIDVIVKADAQPGTWLVHCHVMDHIENSQGLPDGLITAIHYEGTPNVFANMGTAMAAAMKTTMPPGPLGFWGTVLLGAIAGFTIFLGLPIARAQRVSPRTIALLNALAIGILLYLVVEIATNGIIPIEQGLNAWHTAGAPFPLGLCAIFVAGLLLGLVGLGSFATHLTRKLAREAENPLVLAAIIALGIGAHNFAEGLAIGASAASGATAIAIALIVGFGLHNATEGFGVAAPLVGRMRPSWGQIGLAGLIAGGPTFLGTVVGYSFNSPALSVLFLATAVGALVFVIGELWSVLRRHGIDAPVTTMVSVGFLLAMATELYLDLYGG